MLKKLVSVHQVGAQLGMGRPGGLGVPPTGGQRGTEDGRGRVKVF